MIPEMPALIPANQGRVLTRNDLKQLLVQQVHIVKNMKQNFMKRTKKTPGNMESESTAITSNY